MVPAASRQQKSSCTDEQQVVVVGGGFAGLAVSFEAHSEAASPSGAEAAACALRAHGPIDSQSALAQAAKTLEENSSARVILLEASQAVGGRAKSALLPNGQKVELGATWLHGSEGHPVYELAVKYGLMTPADLSKGMNFWKGAQYFRQGEAEALSGNEEKLAKEAISEFAESVVQAEEQNDFATVGAFLRPKYSKLHKSRQARPREAHIVRDAWHWRELLQRGIDGCDSTDDSNVKGLAEYDDLPGPWGCIPGGYQTVAQRMAEDLQDVRYGWIVTEIEWGGGKVTIHCQNGEHLTADAVIMTVSLGVLKEKHASLFAPALPKRKVGAIERLGMGVVDKVFVSFSPEAGRKSDSFINCYNLLWACDSELPLSEPAADTGMSALESCLQHPDRDPGQGAQWYNGIYSLRLGGSEFIRGSLQLADSSKVDENVEPIHASAEGQGKFSASEPPAHVHAVAWLASHHAVNMELSTEQGIADGITAALKAFPACNLPSSFKVVRSTWGIDPFSRGSYSYVPAKASVDDIDALAEPLTSTSESDSDLPLVFFAGEATSKAHMGTTSGAFLTGVKQAELLIDAHMIRRTC